MPGFCPPCKARVPVKVDSIQCDFCKKWHHLECTDLTQGQFESTPRINYLTGTAKVVMKTDAKNVILFQNMVIRFNAINVTIFII